MLHTMIELSFATAGLGALGVIVFSLMLRGQREPADARVFDIVGEDRILELTAENPISYK